MKTRRQHVSDDDVTISRQNARPQTSANGGENALAIPIDLVCEICSRLPAKSVAICSCVSKLWASTLGLSYFTELFFSRSSARPQLLFAYQNHGGFFFFSSPQNHPDEDSSSVVAANRLTHFPFDSYCKIGGIVHGLVCLVDKRISKGRTETVAVICNPSTGESLPLPKVKTMKLNGRSFMGYDPIGKQFKVLSMTWPRYGRRLTLIECSLPNHSVYDETGICISGGLYFQASVNRVSKVICFDVRSEKFTVINLDKGMVSWPEPTLVNYKGKLGSLEVEVSEIEYMTVTGDTKYCLQLWVLVDAEKHEWLKHRFLLPTLWKNVVGKLHVVGVTVQMKLCCRRIIPPALFMFSTTISRAILSEKLKCKELM
ncbi:PREDICTED: F-box protein DOR-like [Camelina sativa]|uniref:F-box protein DOR-like n=1 Tax=Camelina sativa TaxID=90675 RepID=A0ABM0T045_CAMSA|nr:PREDICTED: F-box protein DOR-like [Camelina sativa]